MTTVGICSGKNTHPGHFPPLAFLKEYSGRMVSNDKRRWVTPLEVCVCVLISIQHGQSSSISPAKGWGNMLVQPMEATRFLRGWLTGVTGFDGTFQPQDLPETKPKIV